MRRRVVVPMARRPPSLGMAGVAARRPQPTFLASLRRAPPPPRNITFPAELVIGRRPQPQANALDRFRAMAAPPRPGPGTAIANAFGAGRAQTGLEFTRIGYERLRYASQAARIPRIFQGAVSSAPSPAAAAQVANQAVLARRALESSTRGRMPAYASSAAALRNLRVYQDQLGPRSFETASTARRAPGQPPRTPAQVVAGAGRPSRAWTVGGAVVGIVGAASTVLQAMRWQREARESGTVTIGFHRMDLRTGRVGSALEPTRRIMTPSDALRRLTEGARVVDMDAGRWKIVRNGQFVDDGLVSGCPWGASGPCWY